MKKSITINQPNMNEEGPLLEVLLDLPEGTFQLEDGTQVSLTNKTKPFEPISAIALIDTGASGSTISDNIADRMGLTKFNESIGTNIMGTSEKFKHSAVKILIPTEPEILDVRGEVVRMPLKDKNFDLVIGRDLLQSILFIYNGKEKKFTIEFEK